MGTTTVVPMETPPPDPAVLLATWMDWERGEATPGKTLSDLKRAGMRTLLEAAVHAAGDVEEAR
jgi:hypothetical protein